MDRLPLGSLEVLANPRSVPVVEISIPTYADPIQFETLDVKLARNIFKVVRRSNICVRIQEPTSGVNLDLDINSIRPKSKCA
jgi:hypothetical protein